MILKKLRNVTLIASLALFSFLAVQEAENFIETYRHEEFWFQREYKIPVTESSRKAVKEGKLTLDMHNIIFEGGPSYNQEYLENFLNSAFKTLGIEIRLNYREIHADYRLEALVKEAELSSRKPGDLPPALSEITKYTKALIPEDPYWKKSDIAVFVADFNDSQRFGVTFYGKENVTGADETVTIDGSKVKSQKDLAWVVTHETGHAIGLDHPLFHLNVMSYSSFGRLMVKQFPQLSFWTESMFELEGIKRTLR